MHLFSRSGLPINLQFETAQAISAGATVYSPSLVYVGGTGSVTVTTAAGDAGVVFAGVPAGSVLPVLVTAVTAATATNLVLVK